MCNKVVLRTPLVGYHLDAEALLNFFKIGELITANRTKKKPDLDSIAAISRELGVASFEKADIRKFWRVRSKDVAHDYQRAQTVDRELAVDCKLCSELLIVQDWMDRGVAVVKRRSYPPGPASL